MSKKARDLFKEAMKLADKGDMKASRYKLRLAVSVDPTYIEPYPLLAVALTIDGKFEEAADMYRKGLKYAPDNLELLCGLGFSLDDLERYDEAEAVFRKVLSLEPGNALALSGIGGVFLNTDRLAEAEEYYKQSIASRDNVLARQGYAIVLFEQGRLEEAMTQANASLYLEPDNSEAYQVIGKIFQERGETDEAMRAYERSLDIDPDDVETLCSMASLLSEIQRTEEAAKAYLMALILEPDDEDIQFYYGTTLIKLQDWTAAQAVFTRLVEQDPKNVFYRRNLALAYMFANDPESALYHLEESLQLAPDDQHTRGILDVLYGLTRQDDHATMEMKGALRLEPNEDTSKVQYGKLLNHLLEKLSEATAPL